MRCAVIDGMTITGRERLHDVLERELPLPEWYGRNLDALYDCLTDLHEEVAVRVVHPEVLSDILGLYAQALRAVLSQACRENPRLTCVWGSELLPDQ
ncbi:MAG: barstar family protein [Oscillibacter sp.]|nr:barstar family protein [Oscillibacter sp.]